MITKFDSLFAGHIDMDNVGYAGTAVNERRFPNEALVTVFDKAQAIAEQMDRVGYDTFWMAEHHFQHEGYECIPNVLMAAVHLAHLTRRLRFGCGFNITPMWHPLRLAEDFATADVLTGGRVTFGVGRGYHTREVETFGTPLLDQTANRELFEEQVEIIFKALHQESFSHQGRHYTLPPPVPYRGYELQELTLVPRPLRRPVECWQPIQGGRVEPSTSWRLTASRASSAAARPKEAPCTGSSWRGKRRTLAWGATSSSARVSASGFTSTSPTAVNRASARPASTTRRI